MSARIFQKAHRCQEKVSTELFLEHTSNNSVRKKYERSLADLLDINVRLRKFYKRNYKLNNLYRDETAEIRRERRDLENERKKLVSSFKVKKATYVAYKRMMARKETRLFKAGWKLINSMSDADNTTVKITQSAGLRTAYYIEKNCENDIVNWTRGRAINSAVERFHFDYVQDKLNLSVEEPAVLQRAEEVGPEAVPEIVGLLEAPAPPIMAVPLAMLPPPS